MGKPSTIRDVAELAGVSKSTVSRYLNGDLILPPDTAKRVNDAVRALKYQRNSLARRLSMGSSETIGLAIPDIANPFFAELADAVESAAAGFRMGLALCITRNELEREAVYLGWLDTQRFDGLIFATNRPDDGALRRLIGDRRNLVLVDEDVSGLHVPKVFTDNETGGYLACRHLIEAGHRRIAHVTGPVGLFSVRERLAGYRRALREAGIRFDATLVRYGAYDRPFGRHAAQQLLALGKRPTAIFAGSDYLAVGVLETLREQGLDVPRDMSLVGFDDMEFAGLLMPPLTTLRQSVGDLGRASVEILMAALAGERSETRAPAVHGPTETVRRLPVTLMQRASVGPPILRKNSPAHLE
ncbi:LacI family DNA-binding transcriptional regulator [Robbsia sp. Bb-Pol-6]|uniref:LacI family DNA-binding transcriptional regulator n=1 Tax=Robbsia betulipollinis TaxID=2981849 RepID=A0ABT3ZJB7_9BURK|nr:LacI family DNA-binding transcriptional regulator [Robbsia betulipollinis]MCY0386601.1 LacI family DNA-binding transcriptional regulator [Robbsia betulipollinis]